MDYHVTCECGLQIGVRASDAGAQIVCRCGRSLDVPPLSQLRLMAGQAAYETGTVDTIKRLIRSGELPGKHVCVLSGTPTENTVVLRIQCERVWTRGSRLDRTDKMLLGFLLFGWIGAIVGWTRKDKPRREFGREAYVDVPLRVCPTCQERVHGGGQSVLKTALRKISIYDTLLTEYPEALVLPRTSV